MENNHILFCGWGDMDIAGVCHYRTVLPAKTMDAELVVFNMQGEGVHRSGTRMKHDIIVLQHGWEHWQIRVARNMAKSGAKVIINVDDWLPKVAKMGTDHALSWHFRLENRIGEWKNLLREAHGVICSTPWLMERCRSINPNVALAQNGLDLPRYETHRVIRDTPATVLGWAGGTGHEGSFQSIVPALVEVMESQPQTHFMAVGDDVSRFLPPHLSDRTSHHKWSDMLVYPMHMAKFDISLAPAMANDFFRAKSQLRLYEACAMGTPSVADPLVYDEVDRSLVGYRAESHDDWVFGLNKLIGDVDILNYCRSRALDYCQEIDINNRIGQWKRAISQLTAS